MKSLEILIFDEADRLLDMGFSMCISTILSYLPKQRRTGLFSATQTKEMDEMSKFGLRNPVVITVTADPVNDCLSVTPATLNNFYSVVPTSHKLLVLLNFIKEHSTDKILVFFSTCACVDYLSPFIKTQLKNRPLISLHGKKRKNRKKLFEKFIKADRSVMFSTDVMARGIDIPDIDWVIQFDPPKQSNWFVHRSGRSGRSGRLGNALVLLSSSEAGYPDFLESHEHFKMEELELNSSDIEAERLRLKLVKRATEDRAVLEKGTKAFVSFIQAYCKHDCHLVCSIKDLDVIDVAHCFGLLRLPKMPELRRRDLSTFRKSTMNTSEIKYCDKSRESERQIKLKERREEPKPSSSHKKNKRSKDRVKRKMDFSQEDIDDLSNDVRLMKKLKKGKITKEAFNDQFLS